MATKQIAVLVTTEYKGVFFGYIPQADFTANETIMSQARNCIYWSSNTKGFLGLTADGPNDECRIGAMAGGDIVNKKITSITKVSEKAEAVWNTYK